MNYAILIQIKRILRQNQLVVWCTWRILLPSSLPWFRTEHLWSISNDFSISFSLTIEKKKFPMLIHKNKHKTQSDNWSIWAGNKTMNNLVWTAFRIRLSQTVPLKNHRNFSICKIKQLCHWLSEMWWTQWGLIWVNDKIKINRFFVNCTKSKPNKYLLLLFHQLKVKFPAINLRQNCVWNKIFIALCASYLAHF